MVHPDLPGKYCIEYVQEDTRQLIKGGKTNWSGEAVCLKAVGRNGDALRYVKEQIFEEENNTSTDSNN